MFNDSGGGEYSNALQGECSTTLWFHVSNLIVMIACITPSHQYTRLVMHLLLTLSNLVLICWLSTCSRFSGWMAWNIVLALVNGVQTMHQITVHNQRTLPVHLRSAYEKLFEPAQVSTKNFKKLCSIGNVVFLEVGEAYALEGQTPTDRLALLIDGK